MTKVAATRCAGCGAAMRGRRAGSRWCGAACRMRAQRIGEALGMTEAELGFAPAEYPERSRRFWAGMAAMEARGRLSRPERRSAAGKAEGRGHPSQGLRAAPNANKARTHAHDPKEG